VILIDYANYDADRVQKDFGAPEYSYYFVKRAFRGVLERIGRRVEVRDPLREVDAIYEAAQARGEPCFFLPFCPPNTMPLGVACPTVPVFAWEYDRIPDEVWNKDPREDWTWVLSQTVGSVTHCTYAAEAITRSMGPSYPITVAPAPLFETYARSGGPGPGWREPFDLVLDGGLAVDAGQVDLTLFRPDQPPTEAMHALRVLEAAAGDPHRTPQALRLEGVIYTSILNPFDGRKNWKDLISGFVWAFRETPTATLVLKLTRHALEDGIYPVLRHISVLGPFACRIVLVQGLLSDEAYRALIDVTSFAVNTAYGEGQCLPLMEYMAAGCPVVAPAHSAMLDYLSPKNAFIVRSEPHPSNWPHDERQALRCMRHGISFADYVAQCRTSYAFARDNAHGYAQMSAAAVDAQRAFCSADVITPRLQAGLERLAQAGEAQRKARRRKAKAGSGG
jgi:glycosyltransferase involved in cell wall biosynthesis